MKALVGIIMGSDSDWPTMRAAAEACAEFGIPHEVRVISAHRTPQDLARYATRAHQRGLRVIIAGAGGAAHLPGVTAATDTDTATQIARTTRKGVFSVEFGTFGENTCATITIKAVGARGDRATLQVTPPPPVDGPAACRPV